MRETTIVNSRQIASRVDPDVMYSVSLDDRVGGRERFSSEHTICYKQNQRYIFLVSCACLTAGGILISDFLLAPILFPNRGGEARRDDCPSLPGLTY